MSVTLIEVMSAARCRAASLVSEVAGYIVLGAADQVAGAPRAVGDGDVALAEDGLLRLLTGAAASESEAEASLRRLLGRLLGVSASVTPALLRVSQREPAAGLAALIRELEAALIPVNRAAAKRAMSRLHRDVTRAKAAGKAQPVVEPPPATQTPLPVSQPVAAAPAEEESAPALMVEADELVEDQPETPLEPIFSRRRPPPPPVRESAPHQVPDLVVPPSPLPTAAAPRVEPIPTPRLELSLESEQMPEPEPMEDSEPTVDLGPMLAAQPMLEPEPTPEPEPMLEPEPPLEPEPMLDLAGVDATDRMPEPTPELPPPSVVKAPPRPEAAQTIFDLVLVDLPVLDQTPALSELVTACRDFRLKTISENAPDPDEIVIARAIERTEPLPKVATPAPKPVEPSVEPVSPPERELVPASPIAAVPIIALERLLAPPERAAVLVPAPPRYAPRRSDVEQLVAAFEVSPAPEPRALCDDLKQIAGVDRTQPPPAVTTRTPPPVVVSNEEGGASETPARRSRIGLGALVLTLAVSSGGAVATAVASAPERVLASTSPELGELSECAATLAISGIPAGARASVREVDERMPRVPSRISGDEALFTGLRCREPLEVTVASSGANGQSWIRIPVSAEAMTPGPGVPSEVRVALSVR
jgi:hypothetical protein